MRSQELCVNIVYNLNLIDEESSYENHTEAFNIGFFSCCDLALQTAERYLREIAGFKDYRVSYQITEKRVIGCADRLPASVYIVYGWNENDDLDEIDLIESDCYANKSEAEQRLREMKANQCREKWCIDQYIIDQCHWNEGFVKIYHS